MQWLAKRLKVENTIIRLGFAEFLGTCILVIFGDGSVAQSVLSNKANGEFLSINWSWCMAVMMGAFCCLNVSGGHINPAVSLAMSVIGRLPWKMLPVYMIGQYLGAFVGSAIVYLVYYEAIDNFAGGQLLTPPHENATAGIFSTFPQDYLSAGEGVADQIVGTMMLVLVIMSVTDKKNGNVPKFLVPVFAGLAVFVIGSAYGYNCGYAINPARDLAPRIFTAMAGWGKEVFSFRDYNWFWVPIIGPHIGAILGALIYLLLIELHWQESEEDELSVNHPPYKFNRSSEGEDNEGLGEDTHF